jgi:hypothetical protein
MARDEALEIGATTARGSLEATERAAANAAKGTAWQDEIRRTLQNDPSVAGFREQVERWLNGVKRVIDFEVTLTNKAVYRIEAKAGSSEYGAIQEAWDKLYESLYGIRTIVMRGNP